MATTTFILDEKWPEFDKYVSSHSSDTDHFIVPLKTGKFFKSERYRLTALDKKRTDTTSFQGIYRAIKLRTANKNQNNIFELMLQLDQRIARAAVRKIPIHATHLVISQNLLPFIYETGALGGRTYDVLMTRLPFKKLQERLDFAFSKYPESPTLKDFRVSGTLIELEQKALSKAQKIITAHTEIAEIFKHKVIKLDWETNATTSKQVKNKGEKILFPASIVGRKGAYELRKLVKELDLDVVVAGRILEGEEFWKGLKFEKFDGDFSKIGLVVYPTYVEHQPRLALKAIANGIPVITTTACGLVPSESVCVFDVDDFEGIKSEVKKLLLNMARTPILV